MTNTQDTFTEKISHWLDNELSDTEVTELQTHLQQCRTCRQTYAELSEIDHWLRSAATVMALPSTGFARQVEIRLAQVQPRKLWQIWLAVMGLVFGALFFVGAWATFGGLAVYSAGSTILNPQMVHQGLVMVIDSAESMSFYLELGGLFLRTSVITMQQPVFWGLVLVAAALAVLWVQIMRTLLQRGVITAKLLVY